MSQQIMLNATLRTNTGKGATRRLRHLDKLPAIIYGKDTKPIQITVASKDVRKVLTNELFYSQIVTLNVDGNNLPTIVKEIQRHPAKEYAMHLDFLKVDDKHEVTTKVPLHFLNQDTCIGVKVGGAISHNVVEVEIRCLPKNLPEFIAVDMSNVDIGESVHYSDLTLPDGVKVTQLIHGEEHDLPVANVHVVKMMSIETDSVQEDDSSENSVPDGDEDTKGK